MPPITNYDGSNSFNSRLASGGASAGRWPRPHHQGVKYRIYNGVCDKRPGVTGRLIRTRACGL